MAAPDKITVTNVRTKSLEKISLKRCPYCNSRKEESRLSEHIEKTCPLSPNRVGRHVALAMTSVGFEVVRAGAIVAGYYAGPINKSVLVRLAKIGEFDSYATEHLRGFFLSWDVCIGRIHLLTDDWRRLVIDDEEYAEGTLKGFGWGSDQPATIRQNALLVALGVFSESRIDKVLSMLHDYWKGWSARVDDSIVAGDDLGWFRNNCVVPNSPYQSDRSKLRDLLIADAVRASQDEPNLARILTAGRLTPYVDNFYVVRPSPQAPLF